MQTSFDLSSEGEPASTRKRRVNSELPVAAIIAEYSTTEARIEDIAEKFSTSAYKVSKLLKDNNVPKRPPALSRRLLDVFLKDPLHPVQGIAAEVAIAKKLLAQYPKLEFWLNVEKRGVRFKLNSLAWFVGYAGGKFLEKKYKDFYFEITRPPTYNISKVKVGEDIPVTRILTLKEFLNQR